MGYYPQGAPEMGYLRHMVLWYGRQADSWSPERARHYLAYEDESGKPLDWLFDSVLFTPAVAPSGNHFAADINVGTTMCGEGDFYAVPVSNPATKRDYDDLLDVYFAPGGWLESMDGSITELKSALPAPQHKHNVVLLVPYPGIKQTHWGRLPGETRNLNFSVTGQSVQKASEDRLAATVWFVDEALRRWNESPRENINLLGFYWPFETVYRGWDVDDHWLLKHLRVHLKSVNAKLTWIPFYATYNVHLLDNYENYYFDLAFQQPNHMFYLDTPGIEGPALNAKARHAGWEMEYYLGNIGHHKVQEERHQRFRDYLNGGVEFGYMKESACAWFQDYNAIERMRLHDDPVEREFYHDIYHFIRGDYERK